MIYSKKSKQFQIDWCQDMYGLAVKFSNNRKKIERTFEDFAGLMTILENKCAVLQPATDEDLHGIRSLVFSFAESNRAFSKDERVKLSNIVFDENQWTFTPKIEPKKESIESKFSEFLDVQKKIYGMRAGAQNVARDVVEARERIAAEVMNRAFEQGHVPVLEAAPRGLRRPRVRRVPE